MQGDYHFLHFQTTISSASIRKEFKRPSQEKTNLAEFIAPALQVSQTYTQLKVSSWTLTIKIHFEHPFLKKYERIKEYVADHPANFCDTTSSLLSPNSINPTFLSARKEKT